MHNPEAEQNPLEKLALLKEEYIRLTEEENNKNYDLRIDNGEVLTPEEEIEHKERSEKLVGLVEDISYLIKKYNPSDTFWEDRTRDADRYEQES